MIHPALRGSLFGRGELAPLDHTGDQPPATSSARGTCPGGQAAGRGRSSRTKPRLTTGIEDLTAALRAHARGLYCAEAAVELLIGRWLHRGDFVDRFIETGPALVGDTPMAIVDWEAALAALEAGELPCSGGEGRILRIAASLAAGVPVDLGDAVTALDTTTLMLVARAVLHAGGHRGGIVEIGTERP